MLRTNSSKKKNKNFLFSGRKTNFKRNRQQFEKDQEFT